MTARRLALLGASWCLLGCSDRTAETPGAAEKVSAAVFVRELLSEIEPNGDPERAMILPDAAVVRGNIRPHGDLDFYRFTAEAGNRIYAATETASSSASDETPDGIVEIPPDSVLDLLDANGNVLETDDDNGSMAVLSSSIAGFRIPSPGTYYLRVRKKGGGELRPYDLHFRRQQGSPAFEVEGNDDFAHASPLPASGWVSGSIATTDDVDVYADPLGIGLGSTVFASLDLDPDRDGVEWDGVLEMGPFEGSLLRVNDRPGISDRPSSEALLATVQRSGDYYFRVSSAGAADGGSYALSVSVHPRNFECSDWFQAGSHDVPKEIPEGPGRVTSTLFFPPSNRNVVIQDIDVSVEIVHSHPEDLDVHLRSGAGNDNVLFTDVGSAAFPHIDIDIDDEAAFPITPSADRHLPFEGTALSNLIVRPEVSATASYRTATRLGWFDGETLGGTWTLVVDDDSPGNSGVLRSWGMRVCEIPLPELCPGGRRPMMALDATFETGPQGFSHSGTNDQWFLGTPRPYSGFNGCHRGDQCWKTNSEGDYAADSDQELVSPPIDLTNAGPPILLSWAMKYQLESATYDHAWVGVRELGSTDSQRIWEFLDATMEEYVGDETAPETVRESAGWGVRTADLSAYAGRKVELVFHLDSDSYVQLAGLAIDDVKVSHCGCGDGLVAPGEECDEGARNGTQGGCCSECRAAENGFGCDDGSACTYDEFCTNGSCGDGKSVNCNDGNLCTEDSCSASTGCVHSFNTAPCRVGSCRSGMCVTGGSGGRDAGGAGAGGMDEDGGSGGTARGGGGMGGGEGVTAGEGGETTGGTNSRGGSGPGGVGNPSGAAGVEGGEGGEGAGGAKRRAESADSESSCGCRAPGRRGGKDVPALLVVALGMAVRARRRRDAPTATHRSG